jgi:CheY-like chemotaxis protein
MALRTLGTKELHEFMSQRKVLISDPSTSFTSVIHQTMVGLGCLPENIIREPDFDKAMQFVDQLKPEVIVSEYQLGKGFGLELAEKQQAQFQTLSERIFILVTGNASDSTVAEAAEEEIDGYILKPFNIKQLQDTVIDVMERKRNPSPYIGLIQKGKQDYQDKKYEQAEAKFKEAKAHNAKPSLACFYDGRTIREIRTMDEALMSFREGRKYHPLHYKCLHGEFDVLFEQKKQKEAYEIIKLINQNYPVSPGTLAKMFLLAIYTYNYRDIEKYYDIFVTLDRRNKELIKIVMAALYSAGRFCLQSNDVELALEFFRKGAAVAQREKSYILRIIQALVKAEKYQQAENFSSMFTGDDRESAEFLQLDFEIIKNTLPCHQVLERGKKIIHEGKANADIYREVIRILLEMKKPTAAEEMIFKSSKSFPELKTEFYSLLEAQRSA